jgi:hypothetical protein
MDTTRTVVKERERNNDLENIASNRRLDLLIAENTRFEKARSFGETESFRASLIENPVDTETAVARLGLLTGVVPTTALFLKMLVIDGTGLRNPGEALIVGLAVSAAILLTGLAGYMTGKSAGHILKALEQKSWLTMTLALPFVGAAWGLVSGAAGGIVLFGIGALFGGSIGLAVGAAVLTAFGVLHRLFKTTDKIERNQLIPISVGIVSVIAAVILGS